MKLMELDATFEKWAAERPECVRQLIAKLPPNHLYLLRPAMQRVTLYSYSEDGTVTVTVPIRFNPLRVHVGHRVFGIKPESLEMLPESEREVIKKEEAEALPFAAELEARRKEHWSPEGLERAREFMKRMREGN